MARKPEGWCIVMYGVRVVRLYGVWAVSRCILCMALHGGRDDARLMYGCMGGGRGQSGRHEHRLKGHEKMLTHSGMVPGCITNGDFML